MINHSVLQRSAVSTHNWRKKRLQPDVDECVEECLHLSLVFPNYTSSMVLENAGESRVIEASIAYPAGELVVPDAGMAL